MLGAIAGDIIGSVWEGQPRNRRDAPLFTPRSTFTDDTVRTIAVADWILGGADTNIIDDEISGRFGYDLPLSPDAIRRTHICDLTSAGTLPVALSCALHARDFEDAMRNAIWLGGVADTIACIAGAVAEPLFGLPSEVEVEARVHIDSPLRAVADQSAARYGAG